jgi:hypothetical protein
MIAFDGAGEVGLVLYFTEGGGVIFAARDLVTFGQIETDSFTAPGTSEFNVQLRFDDGVPTATVNGTPLTLANNYDDLVANMRLNVSSGCYASCDGLEFSIDDVVVWPSCR